MQLLICFFIWFQVIFFVQHYILYLKVDTENELGENLSSDNVSQRHQYTPISDNEYHLDTTSIETLQKKLPKFALKPEKK